MYIFLALIGYVIFAVVNIFDKFILTKTISRPIVFTFYASVFNLLLLFLLPFNVNLPCVGAHWALAAGSGLSFFAALYLMYKAVRESEASHVNPLISAAVPLFVSIFGFVFLNESLSDYQYFGIAFMVVGSLLIAFEYSAMHKGVHIGMLYGLIAGLLFAASHVSAKYLYDGYGFYSGFVMTRGMIGLAGAALLFMPAVRQSVFRPALSKRVDRPSESPRRNLSGRLALVGADIALGVSGVVLVQYATALGSVSIVNALAGVQEAVLVIMIALLSKFTPRLFAEKYSRGELRLELIAVVIIALGLGALLI